MDVFRGVASKPSVCNFHYLKYLIFLYSSNRYKVGSEHYLLGPNSFPKSLCGLQGICLGRQRDTSQLGKKLTEKTWQSITSENIDSEAHLIEHQSGITFLRNFLWDTVYHLV